MASSPFLCYFLCLLLAVAEAELQVKQSEMGMEEDEILGLFDVLGSLLDDPTWPQLHPNPCTETPWPGIECETDDESFLFHVTKIHIGPDIVTPPCKSSAHLSASFAKLPYLKVLSIFNCFVESPAKIPSTLFDSSSSLQHLALDSNPSLSGSIPTSFGQIPSLRVLSLSQNNLQGNISNLGGLVNLEQLDLSYNNLTGAIPEGLGGLGKLGILDLSWNILQGGIPSSLDQLQILQKLDLSYNKLTGKIPSELGKLKRLVLLDLSHNFINGPIPEALSGLERLQYFVLNHNPINSGIPLFLNSLKCVTTISLSGSGLTGPIPNSLSSLKNLVSLSLDNNSLIGTVPEGLGSIPNLNLLNLSNNKLSGEIGLPEKFIERVGRRLDVRGNSGLCIRKKNKKKNNSVDLEIPICLDKIGNGDHEICPDEENPEENKGMQQSSMYHDKTSSTSNSLSQECPVQYLLLFVLFYCLFL